MLYKIKDYEFSSFKLIAHMHHSNYAILENEQEKGHGIKYCPHLGFEEEFFILRELNHPQIPKAYDYGKEMMYKDGKEVLIQNFVVLDHMSSTDLVGYFHGEMVKALPEKVEKLIKCFISACDPLDCLHSLNYVHTDLKPGHLMLDPENDLVFFIDFELVIKKHGLINGISKDYASPEHMELLKLLRDPPEGVPLEALASNVGIDGRADIYSLGTIFFEILTQEKWSETKTPPKQLNNLISQELNDIVMSMLEEDPDNRVATAKELKESLQKIL